MKTFRSRGRRWTPSNQVLLLPGWRRTHIVISTSWKSMKSSDRANFTVKFKNAPAGKCLSEFLCFWWRSLPLLSAYWSSACIWNRMTATSHYTEKWNKKWHFFGLCNLQEKLVLGFSVKLINAQLEYLQTFSSLLAKTEKKNSKYSNYNTK